MPILALHPPKAKIIKKKTADCINTNQTYNKKNLYKNTKFQLSTKKETLLR